jgi:hypothetical protein
MSRRCQVRRSTSSADVGRLSRHAYRGTMSIASQPGRRSSVPGRDLVAANRCSSAAAIVAISRPASLVVAARLPLVCPLLLPELMGKGRLGSASLDRIHLVARLRRHHASHGLGATVPHLVGARLDLVREGAAILVAPSRRSDRLMCKRRRHVGQRRAVGVVIEVLERGPYERVRPLSRGKTLAGVMPRTIRGPATHLGSRLAPRAARASPIRCAHFGVLTPKPWPGAHRHATLGPTDIRPRGRRLHTSRQRGPRCPRG